MARRREALKIIGAISSTCAFPFSAAELYGQHEHAAGAEAPPPRPRFFKAGELATVTRIADLIIPATATPGAVAAGVPAYVDSLVAAAKQHQQTFRAGLRWLDQTSRVRHGKAFVDLTEPQQTALLTPLCEAADAGRLTGPAEKFFHAMKAMTADGYYTSRIGMTQELGFSGGAVLAEFPGCPHEH